MSNQIDGAYQIFYSIPGPIYIGTKTSIEALTGVQGGAFAVGYTATPADGVLGFYDGSAWVWGSGGGGGVESVTGDLVDNTDPANPVVNLIVPTTTTLGGVKRNTGSAGQYVTGIDTSGNLEYDTPAGTGVESVTGDGVNNTDPLNPVISYPTPGDIGAEPALGYTPENVANKSTDVDADKTSNTKYPSVKAVYDWAVGLFVQKNAGITGATKTKITYDAKGLVTSGTNLSAGDIPDLDASKITSGTMATARLGSGTADGAKRLAGDQTWVDAPNAETNSDALYRCNSAFASGWTGTINGAPSGANVTVTTSTGNIASITPSASTHLAKMRLFNTTRGTYALINSVSGSVVTLTANAPAGWANGDSLTVISTVVVSGDGRNWCEFEITSGVTKESIFIEVAWTNTTAGKQCGAAPIESFSFYKAFFLTSPGQATLDCQPLKIYNGSYRAFSLSWQDAGTNIIAKYKGFLR